MENEVTYQGKAYGMTGSRLKIIAIIIMFIDHFAAVYLDRVMSAERVYVNYDDFSGMGALAWTYLIMRLIGRVAFPIFIFLLIEGVCHTRNRWKYLGRLAVFALISEIPFDMAFNLSDDAVFSGQLLEWTSQNVFFTLAVGLLAIIILDIIDKKIKGEKAGIYVLKGIASLAVIIVFATFAEFFGTDYGFYGVLAVCAAWFCKNNKRLLMIVVCVILTLSSTLELAAFFAIIPVSFYNGERGSGRKYSFYAFYPIHLLLLWGLCFFMGYMK